MIAIKFSFLSTAFIPPYYVIILYLTFGSIQSYLTSYGTIAYEKIFLLKQSPNNGGGGMAAIPKIWTEDEVFAAE